MDRLQQDRNAQATLTQTGDVSRAATIQQKITFATLPAVPRFSMLRSQMIKRLSSAIEELEASRKVETFNSRFDVVMAKLGPLVENAKSLKAEIGQNSGQLLRLSDFLEKTKYIIPNLPQGKIVAAVSKLYILGMLAKCFDKRKVLRTGDGDAARREVKAARQGRNSSNLRSAIRRT